MEWAEGWANENENENENESEGGLESSSTEGESSLAPSHEMNDNDDGLKARLSAVADCLVATPRKQVFLCRWVLVFNCLAPVRSTSVLLFAS